MTYWYGFLDSLNTPGGHILILVGLLCYGILIGSMELQAGAMGALFLMLRPSVSNHERQNGASK